MIITIFIILGITLAATALSFLYLYKREYNRRRDEISRVATIKKEKDAEIAELESEIDNLKWDNDCLQMQCDGQQDKLSTILCPTNNHVWKDGVCVKCGRVKDG